MNLTLATPARGAGRARARVGELRLATKRNREVFNLAAAPIEGAPASQPAFRVITAALH